jgi:hypothetical protein
MLREIWRRVTSSRYAGALEDSARTEAALIAELARQTAEVTRQCAEVARQRAEIDRLRGENRALLNSILGIAGVPPIYVQSPPESLSASRHSEPPPPQNSGEENLAPAPPPGETSSNRDPSGTARPRNDSRHSASPGRHLAAPLRRRSWHQINRMLEIEAARKTVTSDS